MATNPTQQTTGNTNQGGSKPPKFNPKDFNENSTTIDNPFFPLTPGTTFVYKSTDGSSVDTEVVTDNPPKTIDGVKCVTVDDTVSDSSGNVSEHTLDYYAQDKKGNVWYFGEDSQTIENGQVVSTEGSWLAGEVPEGGKHPAKPGIIMEANPQLYDSYNQENAAPVAQDAAEVLSLDASANVPYSNYDGGLLLTLETSAVEPGAAEVKYYARRVGEVSERDLVTQEQLDLISVSDPRVAQLVQSMASLGASGPGTSTLSSTLAANDPSLPQVLAAQHG
jgi:hypothetical protein